MITCSYRQWLYDFECHKYDSETNRVKETNSQRSREEETKESNSQISREEKTEKSNSQRSREKKTEKSNRQKSRKERTEKGNSHGSWGFTPSTLAAGQGNIFIYNSASGSSSKSNLLKPTYFYCKMFAQHLAGCNIIG